MTDEKWQEIIAKIKDNFEVIEHITQDIPQDLGPGQVESILFNGPVGKVKMERTTQPLVLDKKTIGSKRIGSGTTVTYIYSETEKVHRFKAYLWNETDNDWVELKLERGEAFF